jgi:D-3-phosphoglycerate dehydrogenase
VVDIKALAKYLNNGKIKGAAVDVFPKEPSSNDELFASELQNIPNVILTPHIGGSTLEAQKNIANFVAKNIINFINTGNTLFSVGFPSLQLDEIKDGHRFIHIHENVPGILAQINNVFAKNKINIMAQYLKTNESVGYVITDVVKRYNEEVVNELRNIQGTLRLRVLY